MLIDLLIENARVLTQDPDLSETDRLGVLHGRVVARGEECDGLRASRRVDAQGAVVVHVGNKGE